MEEVKISLTPQRSDTPMQPLMIGINVPLNTEHISNVLLQKSIPIRRNANDCHVPSSGEILVPVNSNDCYVPGSSERATTRNITPWNEYLEKTKSEEDQKDELLKMVLNRLSEVPEDPIMEKTIFRVPSWFHEANKDLFEPKMVSIGPYHRGKESLRFMEEQKWSFLRDFVIKGEKISLKIYLEEMRAMEAKARRCYSNSIDMGSDEFVMMLLLDGSFLLEHFFRLSHRDLFAAVCNFGWADSNIMTDLVLLENQIPFFVIHKLFNIQGGHTVESPNCPLLNVLLQSPLCACAITKFGTEQPPEVSCNEIYHILHLVYKCIVPNNKFDKLNWPHGKSLPWSKLIPKSRKPTGTAYHRDVTGKSTDADPPWTSAESKSAQKERLKNPIGISCASMLQEAGVKFKRKKSPRHMFDISFHNGIMEIPFISLNFARKIAFANFAAFEQTVVHTDFQEAFTGYLVLMDALVNTEKDIAVLERSNILENMLSCEEDAAAFFNDLGKFFIFSKYERHYLFDDIRRYSNSTWHKQRARLMHDYFNSPWSAISAVAAGMLLILSVLQTYYSAR